MCKLALTEGTYLVLIKLRTNNRQSNVWNFRFRWHRSNTLAVNELKSETLVKQKVRVFVNKNNLVKVKVKVWTLTWVRLMTSSALQSRKWQMIGMSQWCRSALCGHPLPALTGIGPTVQLADTPAPQSATLGVHPVAVATTHFPSRWG